MALTYLQLVQLLSDELDYAQPTTLQGSVSPQVRRMKNHVNRAYNYIWLQLNPSGEEAETSLPVQTTPGMDFLPLPAELNHLDEVQFGQEPPMKVLPWPEFQGQRSSFCPVSETGAPTLASVYQRRLYLHPVPDAEYALTIRGKAALTELAEDTDTPQLRSDFHRVVLEWALYLQMVYENNPMAPHQLQVAAQVFDMAKNNSRVHQEQPPQFRLE